MSNLDERIKKREAALQAVGERRGAILTGIGREVIDAGLVGGEDTALGLTAGKAKEVEGSIPEIETVIAGIQEAVLGRQTAREAIKAISGDLKSLEEPVETARKEFGKAAWEVYRKDKIGDAALGPVFADLMDVDQRLRTLEEESRMAEADKPEKGLGGLIAKGRRVVLGGRRRGATDSMERHFVKAGKRIEESGLLDEFTSTSAASTATSLTTVEEKRREMEATRASLKKDEEEWARKLQEAPGSGTPQRKIASLENQIETIRSELDDLLRGVGDLWMDSPGETDRAALVSMMAELEEVSVLERAAETDLETLRGYRELEKMEGDKSDLEARVSREEKEIEDRKSRLKILKKELSDLNKELTKKRESLPPDPGD